MDLESPKFSKSGFFVRDKASRIQRIITLAIAVGITLGCTQPLRSAQPEAVSTTAEVSTDSILSNDPEVSTVPEESPLSQEPVTSVAAPTETLVAYSEVEMMRIEALETAIIDENLTQLTSYCRMGECLETYYTFTYLDQEANGERLYQTEVLTYQIPLGEETGGEWILQEASTQVLCSTQRPMVIFFKDNEYFINNMSPGTEVSGAFLESDALYWAVCHDINMMEPFNNPSRREKALELGYSLDLTLSQTRQPFINLMDN
ncbi:hypothetical protein [Oscillatoria acuminata]|uniref:Uncharacterized protein n=1 Tax=Oscillatoria acuminata PCC 6304 TaxID=56110 RepID=K9TNM0_9CYAN|nr:hypothetical protein [Oscillatoria acuminata]AFY84145.1 hypothetical protein Oscil6304_4632 [Oscillatoria acuminata PCC 6304]